jgi:hypothetical protein
VTLTLPLEYRPKYRTFDPLLQSSSEQTPINLDLEMEALTTRMPTLTTHYMPSTKEDPSALRAESSPVLSASYYRPSTPFRVPNPSYAASPVLVSTNSNVNRWQPPVTSWTYRASAPGSQSTNYHTFPQQHGRRGGRGYRGRGRYRGRNDFYVGRVNIPPVDLKSLLPWKTENDHFQKHCIAPPSPLDYFLPQVLRRSSRELPGCSGQLDTWSTWKGLSSVGAEELFMWANIHDTVLSQATRCDSESDNLSGMVVRMVTCFERRPPSGFNWFLSAPNLYQRVEKFLSLHMNNPLLHVEELELPVVGQEYTLAPLVVGTSDNTSVGLAKHIAYSTSAPWLFFDKACNVFSGIIPATPPRSITVKATTVEYLDDRVRVERVLRARVDLSARCSHHSYICPIDVTVPTTTDASLQEPRVDSDEEVKMSSDEAKPRKHVSFMDGTEGDSVHSSPDHLKSFFNDLATLTYDDGMAKYHSSSLLSNMTRSRHPPGDSLILSAGLRTVEERYEEGCNTDGCPKITTGNSTASTGRRLADAKSSTELYSYLRQHPSEESASAVDRVTHASEIEAEPLLERTENMSSAQASVHISSPENKDGVPNKRQKPLIFLHNHNDSLGGSHIEVATALACPEPRKPSSTSRSDRPLLVSSQDKYPTLSNCCDMDRPTSMRESSTSTVPSHQSDADAISEDEDSAWAAIGLDKQTWEKHGKEVWKDLCRWSWRGWEQEIGLSSSRDGEKKPDHPSNGSGTLGSTHFDSFFVEPDSNAHTSLENDEPVSLAGPTSRPQGYLPSPSLSAATTTIKQSRNPSEASWTIDDDATVFNKLTNYNGATNPVNHGSALYETVRSQFYNDHDTRQLSSPRHSKSSSARTGVLSVFTSDSDHSAGSHSVTTENGATMADPLDEVQDPMNAPASANPSSLQHKGDLVDRAPDIGSIAAAVKKSLEVEVEGEDVREKAEIRKGFLHHQVMELQMDERRRHFGGSNYDDVFWSSEGGSTDLA